MKNRSAFTIVELLVVVSIITILAAISIFAYDGAQKDSRDADRKGNTTVISEALEKYYDKNGEYPSVASLVNNGGVSGQDVATKLGISLSDLNMPRLPSGTTNPLTSTNPPTNDNITYAASSDVNNSSCQSNSASGCDQFSLQYIAESGQTISIPSRHRSRANSTPTTPDDLSPSLALSTAAPNVVATTTAAGPCNPLTLTQKYAFSYRSQGGNDTVWTAWSDASTTWQTSKIYNVVGTSGSTYEFIAYTRCDNGGTPGTSSAPSTTKSIVYPITQPSAPTISTVLNADTTVTFTISAVTCSAGSTPQYSYRRRVNEGTYPAWSAWGTGRAWMHATSQGYQYVYQPKARCHMTNTDSLETIGGETTYVRPINAPAAPSVSVTPWDGSVIAWNWGATPCPSGTTAQYQRQWGREGYLSAWLGPVATTTYNVNTSLQGYEYYLNVQAQCYSSYAQSNWSTSGNASTITPITAPGSPTDFILSHAPDRMSWRVSYTNPTCGSGTQQQHQYGAWIGSSAYTYGWLPGPYIGWQNQTSPHWSPAGFGNWVAYKEFTNETNPTPPDVPVRIKLQYRCTNPTTNRSSSLGPETFSPIFYT